MIAKAALTLASAAALLLSMPALGSVIAGGAWWGPAAFAVVAVALTGLGLRALRLTVVVLPLVQAVVLVCVLTGAFASFAAPLGFVPTPAALGELLRVFEEGRGQIGQETTPIPATPALALIVAAAMGALAIVGDFLAVTARTAALMALPVAGLLVVPLLVDDQGLDAFAFASAAVGYVVLLAVDGAVRGAGWGARVAHQSGSAAPVLGGFQQALTTAGVAAVAVVLALLVPLAIPGLSSSALYALADGGRLGGDTITTTHPLVSLRRNLNSPSDRPVLTYTADTPTPGYLRMYSLDVFDGQNWTMSRLRADGDGDLGGELLPSPPGQTDIGSDRVVTEVSLADGFAADFLPAPYPPREVDVSGRWFADADSLMVFTTGSPASGTGYAVTSLVPRADPDLLTADLPPGSDLDPRYLDVPEGVDPRTADLAAEITADADSAYERALALQDWFTAEGRFTYDLTPPQVPEGTDPLAFFLFENRVGYCEQFAAAMALLARQAGVPARVATGFTSGTRLPDGGWEVTESDAHAWPELYFEGLGWLRFEPTPAAEGGQGTATVPDYAQSPVEAAERPSVDRPSPEQDGARPSGGAPEPQRPSGGPESAEPGPEQPEDGAAAGGGGGLPWRGLLVGAAVVAGAVLLVGGLPALARWLVRRGRWLRAATAAERAHAAWRELHDDCRDLGLAWNAAESPRAVAERLSAESGLAEDARAALWRLAMAEESARYAPRPSEAGALPEDGRRVRAALRAARGRTAALTAVLLPRSLLRAPAAAARRAYRPDPAAG
ncbi:transglutaminaseTgpA domain-containing protein [Streptomonospora nanhaiensis]|uniref:Transglutaminase-like putative cysteine protease n=1 Tax=Streptomonospora nanhaiensis TaxID=1323731 RepID=A0A853BJF5_9ACTN|nr:DUF3488 and transglutaminase-like domain-containing protein [Streptomonospora nanhaiensis]MBX9389054.1 DUF3488 and transglutaminase-like domain-containing protein [Streptomonospora nanhaiensis]NYI94855.1 transglutaminase-like putative cysteine protease [Streptomonospora nanhaiensis]